MKYDLNYFRSRSQEDPRTGCWNWTKARNPAGYGRYNRSGKAAQAHRGSLAAVLDVEPSELGVVCHHCDNPSCVNPQHLYNGTHSSNLADKVVRERVPRGSAHWQAALCERDVQEIRLRVRTGENKTAIAALFGVSVWTVKDIASGRGWREESAAC